MSTLSVCCTTLGCALALTASCASNTSSSNGAGPDAGSDPSESAEAKQHQLTVSPSTLHLTPGTTSSFTLALAGKTGSATLGFTEPPDGVDESSSVSIKYGGSTKVSVTTEPGLGAQTVVQTITSTGGGHTYTAKITLIVDEAASVDAGVPADAGSPTPVDAGGSNQLTVSPSTLTIARGTHATFTLSATGHGSSTLDLDGAPAGLDESGSPFVELGGSVAWDVYAEKSAPLGTSQQSFSIWTVDGGPASTTLHFVVTK